MHLRIRRKGDSGPGALASDAKPGVVMREWLRAVMTEDQATAFANLRAGHSSVWLVAAMMSAKPSDASSAELIGSAAKVSPSDAAYVAVAYHRLRLMGPTDEMRDELMRVRPRIERTEGPSTGTCLRRLMERRLRASMPGYAPRGDYRRRSATTETRAQMLAKTISLRSSRAAHR